MDGSRRVRATSVLPSYGPTCLFKGHLGTKSNAFCTDSSSLSLSTLQLVKNHMAVHYNKILSAKAVVDCSIPLSVSASIKYADQQRREKLKKELARYEKEFKAAVQANSKTNSKSLFNTIQKPSGEPQDQDVLIKGVNGFPSFEKSLVPSSESQHLSLPKSDKIVVDGLEHSSSTLSRVDHTAFRPRKPCCRTKHSRRPRSAFPHSHRLQLIISKTPDRDLLDKHSELFSDKQLPFTPRTLKTEAKSFLSQYRYYTPAKRKKDFMYQQVEAETQTELSSFNSDFGTAETKNLTDSEVNPKQASNYMTCGATEELTPLPLEGPGLPWQENKDGILQPPSPRTVCQYAMQVPSESKIYSDDEELSYLSFMQDVTDEILKLGLFSNRFLERLFERHIEQNKHHLKEEKMRHLLHGLKVDLGCTSEKSLVKPNAEEDEFKNARDIAMQERQQYQKALDMLLCAPKDENEVVSHPEFFMPLYKAKYSDKVIIQQLNEEPSIWDENNPDISDGLVDQETSVYVIESDSDTEKVETSHDICHLRTSPTKSLLFSRVKGVNGHDRELPTLKIMNMSIEDCPSDV